MPIKHGEKAVHDIVSVHTISSILFCFRSFTTSRICGKPLKYKNMRKRDAAIPSGVYGYHHRTRSTREAQTPRLRLRFSSTADPRMGSTRALRQEWVCTTAAQRRRCTRSRERHDILERRCRLAAARLQRASVQRAVKSGDGGVYVSGIGCVDNELCMCTKL